MEDTNAWATAFIVLIFAIFIGGMFAVFHIQAQDKTISLYRDKICSMRFQKPMLGEADVYGKGTMFSMTSKYDILCYDASPKGDDQGRAWFAISRMTVKDMGRQLY